MLIKGDTRKFSPVWVVVLFAMLAAAWYARWAGHMPMWALFVFGGVVLAGLLVELDRFYRGRAARTGGGSEKVT